MTDTRTSPFKFLRSPGGSKRHKHCRSATSRADRITCERRDGCRRGVIHGLHFEREIGAGGVSDHALVFRARVGDRELRGCDFLRVKEAGLIDELTVMVRPLSAALAVAEAMKTELPAVQRELGVTVA